MKKSISVVLAAVVLFVNISLPFSAFAMEDFCRQIVVDNFLGAQEDIGASVNAYSNLSLKTDARKDSVKKTYNGKTYYGDGRQLYSIIRSNMLNKNKLFTIRYYSNQKLAPTSIFEFSSVRNRVQNVLYGFHRGATDYALSTTSTDGDYLRWSVYQLGINDYSCDKTTTGGYYYYTIELDFTYLLTKSQEAKLDKVIDSYITSLRNQKLSDYQIVKRIHDHICASTTYDYAAADNESPKNYEKSYSAYGALISGECVCQGYALAFYRICKELGYSVRLTYSNVHGWNLIRLDGKYYFVDCTWDDEVMDSDEVISYDETDDPYYYFLVNEETLVSQDGFDDAHAISTDLTEDDYYVESFEKKYAKSNYDYNENPLMSTASVYLSRNAYTYNGSERNPTVRLYDKGGNALQRDVDYTLTYVNSVHPNKATVRIKGIGDYSGMSTQRTYIINPAKMTEPVVVSGSRMPNSIKIKWKQPAANISGYLVQVYKSGKWVNYKTITSPSTTTCKITDLKPSTNYSIRICSYKVISNIKRYGEYSGTLKTCTSPSKVTGLKLSSKSNSITAKWSSVKCDGYQIRYSTSSNMAKSRAIKLSADVTSKKIKSLKKGKKYYVQVRAYKKLKNADGKIIYCYSNWSVKKSVIVK